MTPRTSVRLLCRAGTVVLLAAGAALAAAPAAVADEAPPTVALDPPDAAFFLLPVENFGSELEGAVLSASSEGSAPSVSAAQIAALAPPEIARTFGQEGVSTASHNVEYAVDAEYGGTVDVRLPPLVDASDVEISLGVLDADDEGADPRVWSDDPAAADQLVVADLGGNELRVTLPADDGIYGPEALLVLDGLASTDSRVTSMFPLIYDLELTPPGGGPVTLEPAVGVFASANCSMTAPDPCPATDVRAGGSFDLTVPASSLLRGFDAPRLDTAEVDLLSDDWDSLEEYSSTDDPSLVTRHGAWSASVNLPDDIGPGTYQGAVAGGNLLDGPAGGGIIALVGFEIDVAAVNPGLRSETGWVDDVREASAGSTKAVAGIAMLVVAGLITVVAVAPKRRPPTER